MWGRIYAIAKNTFIEAARNRAFIGLGLASVGIVVSALALSSLAVSDQQARVLVDYGLFVIGLLEVVIAIILGVILIHKEVDRKTFYLVLSKPVRREEVVLGKFLGLCSVLAIALVIMSAAWLFCLRYKGVEISPWMGMALVLSFLEALVVTSIAVFFSSFATPILSGVFTFGFFLLGRSVVVLRELLGARRVEIIRNPIAKSVAWLVAEFFPDLSVFDISKEIILVLPVSGEYLLGALTYALGFVVFFLASAMVIFRRRDFL